MQAQLANSPGFNEDDFFASVAEQLLSKGVAKYGARPTKSKSADLTLRIHGDTASDALTGIVKNVNKGLAEAAKRSKSARLKLLTEKEVSEVSEDELVLLHRFAKKRDALLSEHEFLEGAGFALLMGLQDKNASRKLKPLREKHNILYVEVGGAIKYPSFQLNPDTGSVYEALREELPRLIQSGRSGWDVCFWLNQEQSVTLKRVAPNAAQLKGISIEDMLKLGKKAAEQTERYTGTPLSALHKGEDKVFSIMVEHLLNPDYRVIPTKEMVE